MPYTKHQWVDGSVAAPAGGLSAARLTDIENGLYSAYTTYNVKDSAFGAVGDGVTDDTAAIQAALNALPNNTDGQRGGVIYFPEGVYRLTSTLTSNRQNLCLLGPEGGQGQWLKVNSLGNAVLMAPAGSPTFTFNNAGANTVFCGPTIRNLSFTPPYGVLTNGQTLTSTLTIDSQSSAHLASSGTGIIQDRWQVGVFTYTGKTSTTLTGCSIVSENVPGATYQARATIVNPSPYGVKLSRTNDFHLERCTFANFNDTSMSLLLDDGTTTITGGTGLVIDGTVNVAQYGTCKDLRFYGCYRGAQEVVTSTRWFGGDFDGNMNAGTSWAGAIGWIGLRTGTIQMLGTNFHGFDTLIQTDGGSFIATRFEDWITAAVNVVGGVRVVVMPASANNFQGGAVGTGVALDSGTSNSFVLASQFTSVANKYTDAGTQNTIIDVDRIQTKGTIQAVGAGAPSLVANIGSTYRRTDGGAGTTFYVKESGNGLSSGWVAK